MSAAEKLKPYRFKPGQSGNPTGRPPIPPELRGIASLTQGEVTKLVSKYARMTRDELQASIQSSSTPMLEMTIASIFAQAVKQGDYARLAFLLDRAVGKVQLVDFKDDEIAQKSTAELLQIIKEQYPNLEAG